eukprot:766591-Hanusia_phi.AAC.5
MLARAAGVNLRLSRQLDERVELIWSKRTAVDRSLSKGAHLWKHVLVRRCKAAAWNTRCSAWVDWWWERQDLVVPRPKSDQEFDKGPKTSTGRRLQIGHAAC